MTLVRVGYDFGTGGAWLWYRWCKTLVQVGYDFCISGVRLWYRWGMTLVRVRSSQYTLIIPHRAIQLTAKAY